MAAIAAASSNSKRRRGRYERAAAAGAGAGAAEAGCTRSRPGRALASSSAESRSLHKPGGSSASLSGEECSTPPALRLPDDLVHRILAPLSLATVLTACQVCRHWRAAARSLREAVQLVLWGKRLKHGRGVVVQNTDKALDAFLKAGARGSAPGMVDAGVLLWEKVGFHSYARLPRRLRSHSPDYWPGNRRLGLRDFVLWALGPVHRASLQDT